MQWLYILLCAYDGFYGNYLYNGFLCRLFGLKLLSVWKGILRFVSMLFQIFEKLSQVFKIFEIGYEQKNVLGFLRFCKYAIFNIWKKV